ncbi:PilW family protein [Lysobacter sp. TAF61]|uniref:PilW family protein n=1 Tax=Lysobacter sp. TAF61 TaxID=3233072 RepID=UPI003F9C6AE3
MRHRRYEAAAQGGFSLIEVLISLVLGLLVLGAAIAIFLTNQKTYRATESLGRIQENARIAFELMARDVREAAGNPCGKDLPVANILNGATGQASPWWMKWERGLVGYNDGALAGSAKGTDAIEFLASSGSTATLTETDARRGPSSAPGQFKVHTGAHGLRGGDIVLVCDYTQVSILQLGSAADGNTTVDFARGNGSPGNCTKGLGLPVVCNAQGSSKLYGRNALIAKLHAVRWFVDDNGRKGRSLYRVRMDKGTVLPREEIAENIHDLQMTYLVPGQAGYVHATDDLDWKRVVAVQIALTVRGVERAGVDRSSIARSITHVVMLRNRAS